MKKNYTTYKNDYTKQHYERISLVITNKSDKDKYCKIARDLSFSSLNAFIVFCVEEYIKNNVD